MTQDDESGFVDPSDERVAELTLLKKKVEEPPIRLESQATGRSKQYSLISYETYPREEFLLDIENKTVGPRKWTFQLRHSRTIILVRLDLGPLQQHLNPDSKIMMVGTHLHTWKHGQSDSWAKLIHEIEHFQGIDDLGIRQCLMRFMYYCNIDICDIDPSIFREE